MQCNYVECTINNTTSKQDSIRTDALSSDELTIAGGAQAALGS